MPHQQTGQYDKIFRENLEAVIPALIQRMLHIEVVASEELPDDIQHTKERKPDALKKITDAANQTFVLHLEFQLADEPDMVYRMAEYYIMLQRRYKIPVRQYVLFLGANVPKMANVLSVENLKFQYSLIPFASVDYEVFVRSEKPEEIILGILANFKNIPANNVIQQILTGLNNHAAGNLKYNRYTRQLRILSQLRNLGSQIDKIMDSIEPFISDEKDLLYMGGRYRALEKVVMQLLKQTDFSDEKIANIADVDQEFIDKIKAKLAKQ